jgi:radical SAM protein with 4Fe4S-binding SPASM domain
MTKENVEKLVQILADAGIKQITFSGGEPLLYPYIKEVVKEANDYDMIVHMNTNGYFLTKKLANELYKLGLTQVQINIDSLNPVIHDNIRGKKGSFNRAIKALKNAKDVGLTCASQTVITKLNEEEILDIFRFARSIGIQRCRVSDMINEGRATGKTDLMPTDYIETLKKLSEFAYETGAKNIESGDPLFPLNHEIKLELSGGFCPASIGLFTSISPQGDVYFCAMHRKILYNIFDTLEKEDNLNEIHKIKLKEFIQSKRESLKCRKCNYFKICQGGCFARYKHSIDSTDYWCRFQLVSA